MSEAGIEFEVAKLLEQKKLHVTTAESCTGGKEERTVEEA